MQFVDLLCLLVLGACGLGAPGEPDEQAVVAVTPQSTSTVSATPEPSLTVTPSASPSLTATVSQTVTASPSLTASPSATITPTATVLATATVTPTYSIIRGKVLQQANCRYGPGAPYLYKYGVYPGTVLEIFGRNDAGTWVLVRAIGGTNACWVKADLLELRGDVMAVAPTYTEVPRSPYYGAMTDVSARREGDVVTVFWGGIQLRPGDDSEQVPYVVEAWVCQGGKLVFIPIGSYGFAAEVVDEKGCSEASHARVAAAEKHGYTPWVEVPWPKHED